ncbi:MAG: ATP-binding protein [Actinobacteria bacterium]|nr:ATP-binding protein [Actinomycetota bacterium]
MTQVPEITIEIPSDGSQLSRVRTAVESFASDHGFDETQIYHIKVAVSEAVANAIEHGSPRGSANRVHIRLKDDGNKLVIDVTDEGRFRARLPTFQPGAGYRGRGLFLMSALMDEVDIRETDEGTTLRLIKKREAAGLEEWADIF